MRRRELLEHCLSVGRQGQVHLAAVGGSQLARCQPIRDQAPGNNAHHDMFLIGKLKRIRGYPACGGSVL